MSDVNNGEEDAEDRAIARALNLDTGGEPVDDDALDDYRAVLSYLPLDETAPPPALEDRVLAAALAARPPAVRAIDAGHRRRRTTRWVALGAVATAAAAVVAFMVVTSDDTTQSDVGGTVETISSNDEIAAITGSPGVREGALQSLETVGRVALATDGTGVLYDLTLTPPEPGRALWVWLDTAEGSVPLGALDNPPPGHVGFVVDGDVDEVTGVTITLEQQGATPTTPGALIATARL